MLVQFSATSPSNELLDIVNLGQPFFDFSVDRAGHCQRRAWGQDDVQLHHAFVEWWQRLPIKVENEQPGQCDEGHCDNQVELWECQAEPDDLVANEL